MGEDVVQLLLYAAVLEEDLGFIVVDGVRVLSGAFALGSGKGKHRPSGWHVGGVSTVVGH